MTNEQARYWLRKMCRDKVVIKNTEEASQIAIKAIEKQIKKPKEPKQRIDKHGEPIIIYTCQVCGNMVSINDFYCSHCGQRLGELNETN